MEKATIQIKSYHRREVLPLLEILNDWCVSHFRKAPWLYAPPADQIVLPPNLIYVNEKNSEITIAYEDQTVIALAGGIALDSYFLNSQYFPVNVEEKFRANGFFPDKIWYMGFFLFAPEYRNDSNSVQSFYERAIGIAKKLKKTELIYMSPPSKTDQQEPWNIIGGFKDTKIVLDDPWPTLQPDGSIKTETHKLHFYIKKI